MRRARVLCTLQEILASIWVVRLDQSITPEKDGEVRSFMGDVAADWFGGNISTKARRSLARLISRASKKDEIDVSESLPAWSSFPGRWSDGFATTRFRRQLDVFIEHHKQRIENEREAVSRTDGRPSMQGCR